MRRRVDLAEDLVIVDLTGAAPVVPSPSRPFDRQAFEDTYAVLAFGLGVVPRRRHVDAPPWRRVPVLFGVLTFVMLASSLSR